MPTRLSLSNFVLRDALLSRCPQVFYNYKTLGNCVAGYQNVDWWKDNKHVKYISILTHPKSPVYSLELTLADGSVATIRPKWPEEATHRVVAKSSVEFRVYTNHHGTSWTEKKIHKLRVFPGTFLRGKWRTVVTAKLWAEPWEK